ncbi:H-2 class I histocompatibility antigen, Q9 alpha chain-like isoform X2 [Elgaria multicarinata webbii]|uniref:H-2 class I histocompatibility antigen, Q9 alpha chain-like isoform X2 n=1 Tax=Elgaria multicarinata webbii TaxID=159646 RepID=UPI002FCD1421
MGPRGEALLLLLLLAAGALPGGCSGSSSSSHSLRFFYTGVSEPGQGLPRFIIVGYVDDQLFAQYDSDTRRGRPRMPWMEKLRREDLQFWDMLNQRAREHEQRSSVDLVNVPKNYNQSGGFHTWQLMYGCELRGDGSKGGYDQSGYDGRDYLAFDKETLTWTAADVPAQNTKRKWEAERAFAQHEKAYLEEECIEWLRRYLDYGKETLLRTDPPVGKVTRVAKATHDEMETLVCQAHGFYPKEIDATWTRDGENMDHVTFRKSVAPNSDGTYHTWLSIEIDPKERDHYRCHLDHAGLSKPLVLAWEEPEGWQVSVIVGIIVGILAAVLLVTGIVYWIRKRREKAAFQAVPGSDKGSDGSVKT